ncbi:MAG: hypothetical protein A2W19_10615 [Spirochaetes bacterium RBG_16_49_21]|nr:MAG: hypothetical protein A2W19_10615 [Spirochaetes bacterium RBG_16_49_21]
MKKTAIAMIICMLVSCGKKKDDIKTTIVSYVGQVTINGKAVSSIGETIKYGDIIETGDKSYCEMILNEKNILRLNETSTLVFNISEKESSLDLTKGWLAGVTKKIFSKERTYLIKTPTAVAAIRGTSFCTKVEAPDSTYFCVCNGKIELKKSGGETGDMVESPHHSARRFKKEGDKTISIDKNPGLLYHNDEGIEAMAKEINVTVDWTTVD